MGTAASEKGRARAELGHQESGDTGNRVRAVVSIQQDLCVFRCLRLGSGRAKVGHSSPAFTEWPRRMASSVPSGQVWQRIWRVDTGLQACRSPSPADSCVWIPLCRILSSAFAHTHTHPRVLTAHARAHAHPYAHTHTHALQPDPWVLSGFFLSPLHFFPENIDL